ncbi:cytochrome P450 [Dendryphion nanum]|uniref:Cytochrome P450 n=1 Tax=Dendryphion nanum TaxID=256645 RepID=A0A9P9IUQ6_9PLEO|nr:cytochrome P450 [Dendryphion nanum]
MELGSNYETIFLIGAILISLPLLNALSRLHLHPLSKLPGPRLWSISRLPFVVSFLRGNSIHDIDRLHHIYGPVIRIAPNLVCIAQSEAYDEILNRKDKKFFLKDPIWWKEVFDMPCQLLAAIEPETHSRMKKLLAPGFTSGAVRTQEPILHRYVNLLVERLRDLIDKTAKETNKNSTKVDIASWLNFTTFDIFGDLGFGESFNCLESSQYHPWIAMIFDSVVGAAWIASIRLFPVLEYIFQRALPPSIKKMTRNHFNQIVRKVDRRLNWELERPDIMSHVIRQDYEKKGLTRGELNANFMVLTMAGSETMSTALTGAFCYLVRDDEVMGRAVREVRDAFQSSEDITLDALRDLKYLNGVLLEALRMAPPVPWVPPRLVSKGGAEVCGVWLPEGTPVSILPWHINHHPKYFHSPTKFAPERWLSEAKTAKSPYYNDRREALQPFTVGPRSCIGQHLAWAEMRLILAKLLWNFDFGIVEGETFEWGDLKNYLLMEKRGMVVYVRDTRI